MQNNLLAPNTVLAEVSEAMLGLDILNFNPALVSVSENDLQLDPGDAVELFNYAARRFNSNPTDLSTRPELFRATAILCNLNRELGQMFYAQVIAHFIINHVLPYLTSEILETIYSRKEPSEEQLYYYCRIKQILQEQLELLETDSDMFWNAGDQIQRRYQELCPNLPSNYQRDEFDMPDDYLIPIEDLTIEGDEERFSGETEYIKWLLSLTLNDSLQGD